MNGHQIRGCRSWGRIGVRLANSGFELARVGSVSVCGDWSCSKVWTKMCLVGEFRAGTHCQRDAIILLILSYAINIKIVTCCLRYFGVLDAVNSVNTSSPIHTDRCHITIRIGILKIKWKEARKINNSAVIRTRIQTVLKDEPGFAVCLGSCFLYFRPRLEIYFDLPNFDTESIIFCWGTGLLFVKFDANLISCKTNYCLVYSLPMCCGCRLLKLANAEYANCSAHNDIEAVRHPKSYVLVKEVTKEVSVSGKAARSEQVLKMRYR